MFSIPINRQVTDWVRPGLQCVSRKCVRQQYSSCRPGHQFTLAFHTIFLYQLPHVGSVAKVGMPRNEAQTRFELIDPVLIEQRGWARADIRIEETAAPVDVIYKKGKRRPKGRTDYVLRHPL